MEHDDQTIGSICTRREALVLAARAGMFLVAGAGATQLVRASRVWQAKDQVHLVASPALTEGPFFVDEKLNRSDLVSVTDRASVKNGMPLELNLRCLVFAGGKTSALKGATVDLWSADVVGAYSDEASPMNHENTSGQKWLRGFQVTDANGEVHFKTIVPGWYPGRCPHIHFKVRKFSTSRQTTAEFTSQVFFREPDQARIYAAEPYKSHTSPETTNERDMVFSERLPDGTTAGSHMLLDLARSARGNGMKSQFSILLT